MKKSRLAGKKIGLLSPAGPLRSTEAYELACKRAAERGWELKHFHDIKARFGFLAADDKSRAGWLLEALTAQDIDYALCIRGGYGSVRTLENIDLTSFRNSCVPLIGFSDITALLCVRASRNRGDSAAYTNFHAPNLLSLLGREQVDERSLENFESIISGELRELNLEGEVLLDGTFNGPLLGGNLTVLMSLLGTPFAPDFEGSILFLEDVGEAPYRVDRMLMQARLSGYFKNIGAVILGEFSSGDSTESFQPGSMTQVLQEHFGAMSIPCISGVAIGHGEKNATLPVGVSCRASVKDNKVALSW